MGGFYLNFSAFRTYKTPTLNKFTATFSTHINVFLRPSQAVTSPCLLDGYSAVSYVTKGLKSKSSLV